MTRERVRVSLRSLYEEHVLPTLIDLAMRGPELNALRARSLAPARGRTLEVGFGTGLNARHYGPNVSELVVVDPNPGMIHLAAERLARATRAAQHEQVSGERLPFDDARFDTVVVTFTLCSIPDVSAALREMCRVLRDDGQLLFLEHNRADDTRTARLQARLNRVWMPCSGGCHLDRDAPTLIESAGFTIERLERSQLTTFAGPFAGLAPVFGTIRSGVAHRSPV